MKKILHKRSSEILSEIAQNKNSNGIETYQDLLKKLGSRSFGVALLFFSLPSALPISIVPGISFIFSLPIFIFASQMMFARKTLWLPKRLADHSIPHDKISKIIEMAMPYLGKLEVLLKPRLYFFTSLVMSVFNGIIILILSLFLMLPIPLSNYIFATLIILFALGIAEKDGLFIIAAYLGTGLSFLLIYSLVFKAIKAILT